MTIDFHTHCFPDAIASRAVTKTGERAHLVPYTDGTASDLCRLLRAADVDMGVVLPVVTSPRQFDTVNRVAAEINSERGMLFSFGGIHPDDAEPEAHIDRIKELGLRGIKLHPDFQGCDIDDERYIRIIKYALEKDLVVVTHAGVDDGFPDGPVQCSPRAAAHMLDLVYGGREPDEPRIVLAHGGGSRMHHDVMRYLAGRCVMFDISFIFRFAPPVEFEELIRVHGAERILFGSDAPWGDPADAKSLVGSLNITSRERSLIMHENAERLLRL